MAIPGRSAATSIAVATDGTSPWLMPATDDDVRISAHPGGIERLEELLSIAAHELKTPLTSGMMAVQLAVRGLDRVHRHFEPHDMVLVADVERVEQLLIKATDSLDQLDRLMHDLADVARTRKGTIALRLAPCNLVAILRDAVEEQRQLTPGRVIGLQVPILPVGLILADPDRIRQVVTNYVNNALRYAPAPRPIEVCLRLGKRSLVVAVQDEGPGVPEQERRRIWDRFHRAEPVCSADACGSDTEGGLGLGLGLGLHICKTIVEQHNGRVGQRNVPTGGSIFWFALPLIVLEG